MPGGDDFGSRPIDFHLDGARPPWAPRFETGHGFVEGDGRDRRGPARLVGTRIVLDYPSHTATDNLSWRRRWPRARR